MKAREFWIIDDGSVTVYDESEFNNLPSPDPDYEECRYHVVEFSAYEEALECLKAISNEPVTVDMDRYGAFVSAHVIALAKRLLEKAGRL